MVSYHPITIAEIHPVDLMNADNSVQECSQLGLWVCLYSAIVLTHCHHLLLHSQLKSWQSSLCPTNGTRPRWPCHCS